MKGRCCLAALGLALLVTAAPAAVAQGTGMVLWDRHIAGAVHELLMSDNPCQLGPYRLYRQTCVGNELNIDPNQDTVFPLTALDEIALFVNRHKDLNLQRDLRPGTRLKFRARLSNIYDEEAELQLTLRIRF